jgi:hypothetical protein
MKPNPEALESIQYMYLSTIARNFWGPWYVLQVVLRFFNENILSLLPCMLYVLPISNITLSYTVHYCIDWDAWFLCSVD